ncbi:MAG: NAD(P)-binding domain-containing protein, partial [Haloferacaceae archaeon]|nr:NAD(P)-binding domain-containing protein [Haloferacaceae archaeon]
MELGVIGLGRMGQIVVERTLAAGHTVVAYDRDPAAVDAATDAGAQGVEALEAVCDRLEGPPRLWLMLPAGEPVDATLE